MKRTIVATLVAGSMLVGGLAQAKVKPVWDDPAGDADAAQGLGYSIPAGFDLVSGGILKKGKDLHFVVTHADMPPSGSLPEGFRFLWAFNVDGTDFRITAKSADIGKPDVLAGESNERVGRVDPQGHFRLEGDCATGATVGVLQPVNCKPLEYIEGAFDAGNMAFTAIVPMKSVKAKKGSFISIGGGDAAGICGICWVTHTAERSLQSTIVDQATMTKTYKVR